jgi:hypothetical protein
MIISVIPGHPPIGWFRERSTLGLTLSWFRMCSGKETSICLMTHNVISMGLSHCAGTNSESWEIRPERGEKFRYVFGRRLPLGAGRDGALERFEILSRPVPLELDVLHTFSDVPHHLRNGRTPN